MTDDKRVEVVLSDPDEAIPNEQALPRVRIGRPWIDRAWLKNTKNVYILEHPAEIDLVDRETGVVVYSTVNTYKLKSDARRVRGFAARHGLKIVRFP